MNKILLQRYKGLNTNRASSTANDNASGNNEEISSEDIIQNYIPEETSRNNTELNQEEIQPRPPPTIKNKKKANNEDERLKWTAKRSAASFSSLAGIDSTIEDVRKNVERPLKFPHLYASLGIEPPRGILIYGPTGCGKTSLANAIAGELGVQFISVSATEMISAMSGGSESNIRAIFDEAKRVAPSILFFDEIDLICAKRESAQKEMERRIVSQLMTCMDSLSMSTNTANQDSSTACSQAPVIVLGATSRPESIDPALRRAGRFDRELKIGLPDERAKTQILELLFSRSRIASDVDVFYLSRNTPGYAGADLKALLREAGHSAMDKRLSGDYSMDIDTSFVITMDDFKHALSVVQPAAKREGFVVAPNVTWDDIGALSSVREELRMAVVEPLRQPDLFKHIGINSPSGVLLWGPPGCGKTLLAKAVANETHSNFISIKGPELLNKYVGESERAVRQVFERARMSAPCIIFFDELESLCSHRDDESNSHATRVVNQFLTEMDGLEGRSQVYVIGATNRPDSIDPAMLRPGRLDKLVYVQLPSVNERLDVLKKHTRKTRLSSNVNLMAIAEDGRASGYTGADISNLVRVASELALSPIIKKLNSGETLPDNIYDEIFVTHENFDTALSNVFPSVSQEERKAYNDLHLEFTSKRYKL